MPALRTSRWGLGQDSLIQSRLKRRAHPERSNGDDQEHKNHDRNRGDAGCSPRADRDVVVPAMPGRSGSSAVRRRLGRTAAGRNARRLAARLAYGGQHDPDLPSVAVAAFSTRRGSASSHTEANPHRRRRRNVSRMPAVMRRLRPHPHNNLRSAVARGRAGD